MGFVNQRPEFGIVGAVPHVGVRVHFGVQAGVQVVFLLHELLLALAVQLFISDLPVFYVLHALSEAGG